MNTRWSLLVLIALLAACSDDDADPSSGTRASDGGPAMHDGSAAMQDGPSHDASSQDDASSSEPVDGGPVNCPVVQGVFNAMYTPIDGTCGSVANPTPVPFDGGLHGVNTIMQRLANALITTDIVLKGCSLHMTQKVADGQGRLQLQIDAPELRIESATRITGRITFARYDVTTSAVSCQGTYDAVFSKSTAVGPAR